MLDRHIPRLCHDCGAPMSRQTDDCWKCGAAWVARDPSTVPPPSPARPALSVVGGEVAGAATS